MPQPVLSSFVPIDPYRNFDEILAGMLLLRGASQVHRAPCRHYRPPDLERSEQTSDVGGWPPEFAGEKAERHGWGSWQ